MKFMIKFTKKNRKLKYVIILFKLVLIQYLVIIISKFSLISKYSMKNYNKDTIIKDINKKIFEILKKNFTHINTLYIKSLLRFGNYFISLNNAIIFCEFLNCKRIIIENNKFINNKLFYQKYKLAQPPLCFYEMVLNKFIFRKVFIISEDMSNPVISILLKDFPYVKYNKNKIKLDISYLVNSYNIIYGTSSFLESIIKLNQNTKFIWEYDFYTLSARYKFLHYSVYTFSFNYTIYKLNTSENYKKFMYPFSNSKKQRKLMIEEECDNNFYIISPRIL